MRLVQIDHVRAQAAQACLNFALDGLGPKVAKDLVRAALAGMIVVAVKEMVTLVAFPDQTTFRGQNHLVAAVGNGLAHDLLGNTKAVDGSGVQEIHASIDGRVDAADGLRLVRATPHPATNGPCAESNNRSLNTGSAKRSVLHGKYPVSVGSRRLAPFQSFYLQ